MHHVKNAYPYNMNVLDNPVDTRNYPLLSSSGGRRGSKSKYPIYTGRQIGCRSRTGTRTRTRIRTKTRTRTRTQVGGAGNIVNNLPMDASMIVQSVTKTGADLWNDLKGTQSVNPSPFPFIDQGIKDPVIAPPLHQSQFGGRQGRRNRRNQRNRPSRLKSAKRPSTIRGRRSKSRSSRRFRQSGGDLFNYLPFDMGTTARSAVNLVANVISGTKGLPGQASPLPYNDHALQKTDLKPSDHLPNLPQYYKNANLSIPSL